MTTNEIIQALRHCSEENTCTNCPAKTTQGCTGAGIAWLAADRLEQLQKQLTWIGKRLELAQAERDTVQRRMIECMISGVFE